MGINKLVPMTKSVTPEQSCCRIIRAMELSYHYNAEECLNDHGKNDQAHRRRVVRCPETSSAISAHIFLNHRAMMGISKLVPMTKGVTPTKSPPQSVSLPGTEQDQGPADFAEPPCPCGQGEAKLPEGAQDAPK